MKTHYARLCNALHNVLCVSCVSQGILSKQDHDGAIVVIAQDGVYAEWVDNLDNDINKPKSEMRFLSSISAQEAIVVYCDFPTGMLTTKPDSRSQEVRMFVYSGQFKELRAVAEAAGDCPIFVFKRSVVNSDGRIISILMPMRLMGDRFVIEVHYYLGLRDILLNEVLSDAGTCICDAALTKALLEKPGTEIETDASDISMTLMGPGDEQTPEDLRIRMSAMATQMVVIDKAIADLEEARETLFSFSQPY